MGLAAPAAGGRRSRLSSRRDGPARVRCQRQDSARLRSRHRLGGRIGCHQVPRCLRCCCRRPRLGRLRRLVGRSTRAEAGACCCRRVGTTSAVADAVGSAEVCCPGGMVPAADPARAASARPRRHPHREVAPRLGPRPVATSPTPKRRGATGPHSRSGRLHTAHWSTTAGSSDPAYAPTAAGTPLACARRSQYRFCKCRGHWTEL